MLAQGSAASQSWLPRWTCVARGRPPSEGCLGAFSRAGGSVASENTGKPAVIVTGGAGYIGSHAAEALGRNGFTPVVYDNLGRGFRKAVRYGPFEEGDIRDAERLKDVIARHRPVAIMHFAALAFVEESVRLPSLYFDNNVGGALTVFRTALAAGVSNIIFSSTCAVYGIPPEQPIREDTPYAPINPYGRSKLMAEEILREMAKAEGLNYVALRYFNACGALPSGEIGEEHDPEPHLIPRILMAALGQIDGIDVMGTDYPTPDGTAVRDYIHVCDLAAAHIAALRYLLDGGQSVALNVGTGQGHSVLEVLDAAKRVTGRDIPVRTKGRRPGDPPVLTADVSAVRKTLGFAAQWTDLDRIIETAWRWHSRPAASAGS
jgi:UDP-arabinose 4-epimerase